VGIEVKSALWAFGGTLLVIGLLLIAFGRRFARWNDRINTRLFHPGFAGMTEKRMPAVAWGTTIIGTLVLIGTAVATVV
jgi:hypothetical protein